MNSEITSYPLAWPENFPRTKTNLRAFGRFGKKNSSGHGIGKLTLSDSIKRLTREINKFTKVGGNWRCDIESLIISTNLKTTKSGFPRSGQARPEDPGVAVYFNLDGKERCIPCDTYKTVEDNIAAIAATIEALRTLERHGSNMFEAAFSGFTQLPSPDHIVSRSWRDVLNCYENSFDAVRHAYKKARKTAHPDHGGSTISFNEVEQAWEQAQLELKHHENT